MSRAYYINTPSLPKTDYTYSRMSRHRQEVVPGVMSLPNMSRPSVGTLSMRNRFSAISSVNSEEYEQFVHTATTNSSIQTSVFSRIWTLVSLFISSSFQSVRKYWSTSSTSVYELRTPPLRSSRQESSLKRLSSSLYNILTVIYRGILRVLLLDTWLLSHLRSDRSRPPRLLTLWPILLLILLFAGWSLYEGRLVPTFLSAPLGSMISGVQSLTESLTESTVSVLTTLPFGGVQRVIIDIMLAPWNMLVALLTWLSSLASLAVSSISLITATAFQEPYASIVPVAAPQSSAEKIGTERHGVDALSASLLSLQAEISRLRRDVDELKASRGASQVGGGAGPGVTAGDLNRLEELVVSKEESLLKVIAGAQQQLQQEVQQQLKHKADQDDVNRKMDRIHVEQGVLFARLDEVQRDVKVALDKSQLYWKLAAEGRDTLRKLMVLQMQLDGLRKQVDRCCGQLSASQLKEDIRLEMMHVLHTLTPSAFDDADLRAWVRSTFLSRADLDAALANITANFNSELKRREARILESSEAEISARIAKFEYEHRAGYESLGRYNGSGTGTTDEWQIRRIVQNILAVYDADKTGMSDFALESQGGEVISTRCTETYQRTAPSLSLLGIPLWHPSNSPRTVIQPGMHPGDCWAFAGSQGFLVVRLSHVIYVKGFSYEHVPAALLPTGQIDSAPKNFSVWGLKEEIDKEPVFLGSYEYKENGTSLQYFPVQATDAPPLQHIELHITSNHGNINYTCLYRFRVHGKIA